MTSKSCAAVLALLVLLVQGGCSAPDEEADAAATEVTVETGRIIRTTLHDYLTAYGSVAPEPAAGGRPGGAADLAAPATGVIREVPVSEGQTVRAGDLVVRLEDRMAQADVDRAHAGVRLAEQSLQREKTLWGEHNTSQKRLQEAEQALAVARADLTTAEGMLAQVQLRSPLEGVVSRISVQPGQTVDMNTVVAEVVDLHRLVVLARVPAEVAPRVKSGQAAEVLTAGGADAVVAARVAYVTPAVDPDTGTVLVRLSLPADSGLSPGRFVRVRIAVQECADCLAVPEASLYTDSDGHTSLSVVEQDIASRRPVRTGLHDGDLVEVQGDGLQEGMSVVTLGSYALPGTTRVQQRPAGEPDQ